MKHKRPHVSRRRFLILVLSLAFVFGTILWIFTFRFDSTMVLRAIPAEARVVSWHPTPTRHLEALLKSAPVSLALAAENLDAVEFAKSLEEPGTKTLLHRLAGTGVALGVAPAYGRDGKPALFLGSWVGGLTTHLMRWGWLDDAFDGFAVQKIGRDRIWYGYFPEWPIGLQHVSFAVHEGVLAGCASSEAFAAFPLLLKLKRHGPLEALVSDLSIDANAVAAFRAQYVDEDRHEYQVSGRIECTSDGVFSGRAVLAEMPNGPWFIQMLRDGDIGSLRAPFPLGPSRPASTAAMPFAYLKTIIAQTMPAASREAQFFARMQSVLKPSGDVWLWLAGGDQSGRLMRMKIPSAGFAVQVPDSFQLEDATRAIVDALNALYGTGLIALPDRNNASIQVLRPIQNSGVSAFLAADEYPALTVVDGWLMGVSNLAVMRRALELERLTDAVEPDVRGLKQVGLQATGNMPDCSELARHAMAGYALLRLMQTSRAERFDTPMVRRVLASLDTLGDVVVLLGIDANGHMVAQFSMAGVQEEEPLP